MKYVLDTNAVSELMRGNPAMLARLRSAKKADVAIPEPVLAELEYGIARLPASRRKRLLLDQLATVKAAIGRAPWTDGVSTAFGSIKAVLERRGARLEDLDIAIAAHAVAAGAILVTDDVGHLSRVDGLGVENWSRPGAPPSGDGPATAATARRRRGSPSA